MQQSNWQKYLHKLSAITDLSSAPHQIVCLLSCFSNGQKPSLFNYLSIFQARTSCIRNSQIFAVSVKFWWMYHLQFRPCRL